jgi:hypothetical protein
MTLLSMHKLLPSALLLAFSMGCAGTQPVPARNRVEHDGISLEVESILPQDGASLDVMQPALPGRLEELAGRVQQAVASDPTWFAEQLKKAERGQPLPYDEKLGVTAAEYDEMLALAKTGTMTPVAIARLNLSRTDGRVVFNFGDDFPGMEKVDLDLNSDTVSSPAGVASVRQRIMAREVWPGPWNGVQWSTHSVDDIRAAGGFKFAIGRMVESGRGILYYRTFPDPPSSGDAVRYVLMYDLPTN